MGIPSQLATALLREHRFKPISGTLLSIAKQTVYLTAEQACALVEQELRRTPRVPAGELEIDSSSRGAAGGPFITDRAFYSLFCDADYRCLDVTDYEGADIVVDLCGALPQDLLGRFDFIVQGSCLDNIFDPAAAMRNLTQLLSPSGRIVQFERVSRVHHAYVAFSLSWFHDYFALNEFDDCQAYLVQWDALIAGRWDIYHYEPVANRDGTIMYFGQERWYFPHRDAHALVIAEKGVRTTWNQSPIQYQYRPRIRWEQRDGKPEVGWQRLPDDEDDSYFRSAVRFSRSIRPEIVSVHEKVILPDQYFHYDPQIRYCGSLQPFRGPPAGLP